MLAEEEIAVNMGVRRFVRAAPAAFAPYVSCCSTVVVTMTSSSYDSSTCHDCSFTVSASISPNQDLAMATQVENSTITFNEPMAEINLDLIRLEVLGFKGGAVPPDEGLTIWQSQS